MWPEGVGVAGVTEVRLGIRPEEVAMEGRG